MIVLECETTDLKNLRLVSKVMHGFSTGLFAPNTSLVGVFCSPIQA
jgi:hypothetical protein